MNDHRQREGRRARRLVNGGEALDGSDNDSDFIDNISDNLSNR